MSHNENTQHNEVRGNTLLAKLRRRQLETAQAGRIRESMYYAKLAGRVRRVLCNWAIDPDTNYRMA